MATTNLSSNVVKVEFNAQHASKELNNKLTGIVPKGIYRGFLPINAGSGQLAFVHKPAGLFTFGVGLTVTATGAKFSDITPGQKIKAESHAISAFATIASVTETAPAGSGNLTITLTAAYAGGATGAVNAHLDGDHAATIELVNTDRFNITVRTSVLSNLNLGTGSDNGTWHVVLRATYTITPGIPPSGTTTAAVLNVTADTALASDVLVAKVVVAGNLITGVDTTAANRDDTNGPLVTLTGAGASFVNKVNVLGDSMAGPLTLPDNATSNLHATPKQQILLRDGTQAMTAPLNFGGFKGTNGAVPTVSSDLATKGYVDTFIVSNSAVTNNTVPSIGDTLIAIGAIVTIVTTKTSNILIIATTPGVQATGAGVPGDVEFTIFRGFNVVPDTNLNTVGTGLIRVGVDSSGVGANIYPPVNMHILDTNRPSGTYQYQIFVKRSGSTQTIGLRGGEIRITAIAF